MNRAWNVGDYVEVLINTHYYHAPSSEFFSCHELHVTGKQGDGGQTHQEKDTTRKEGGENNQLLSSSTSTMGHQDRYPQSFLCVARIKRVLPGGECDVAWPLLLGGSPCNRLIVWPHSSDDDDDDKDYGGEGVVTGKIDDDSFFALPPFFSYIPHNFYDSEHRHPSLSSNDHQYRDTTLQLQGRTISRWQIQGAAAVRRWEDVVCSYAGCSKKQKSFGMSKNNKNNYQARTRQSAEKAHNCSSSSRNDITTRGSHHFWHTASSSSCCAAHYFATHPGVYVTDRRLSRRLRRHQQELQSHRNYRMWSQRQGLDNNNDVAYEQHSRFHAYHQQIVSRLDEYIKYILQSLWLYEYTPCLPCDAEALLSLGQQHLIEQSPQTEHLTLNPMTTTAGTFSHSLLPLSNICCPQCQHELLPTDSSTEESQMKATMN